MKPHVFIDFDGVLNAFPEEKVLRRGGIGHTDWMKDSDPRKQVYDASNAFALDGNERIEIMRPSDMELMKLRIHYSMELACNISSLVSNGSIDCTWLSTWQPYTDRLNRILGFQNVSTAEWYDTNLIPNQTHKIDWLESFARNDYMNARHAHPGLPDDELIPYLTPIIWIDDEMVLNWTINIIETATPASCLFIRPDDRIGISRPQYDEMLAWIHDSNRRTGYLLEPLDHGSHIGY